MVDSDGNVVPLGTTGRGILKKRLRDSGFKSSILGEGMWSGADGQAADTGNGESTSGSAAP